MGRRIFVFIFFVRLSFVGCEITYSTCECCTICYYVINLSVTCSIKTLIAAAAEEFEEIVPFAAHPVLVPAAVGIYFICS